MIRLQRYIAQAGLTSRRKAELMITNGQVRVNGRVITELGTRVDPEQDRVEVGGTVIEPEELVYVLLNKPKGYVTTVMDPQGRHTVMELLPQNLPQHVKPVGRLDFYTEGVLLFTNDGELAAKLLAPRGHVEKTYHVKIRGQVTKEQIEKLRRGVTLRPREHDPAVRTLPAKVDVLRNKDTGVHTWLVMSISEGRSRQIHRMAEALNLQVIKLARVAFAGITYFGLKVGQARKLTQPEIAALRRLADEQVVQPSDQRAARSNPSSGRRRVRRSSPA